MKNRVVKVLVIASVLSPVGNRGKSRGGGMIIRFPGMHESDSLLEWCRLQTLMIFRWVI
jgi:hypothetical protein